MAAQALNPDRTRAALIARRDDLRQRLEQSAAAADFERGVSDLKDDAERSEASNVREAQQALELAELVDVEAALVRQAAGSYGDCIDCGAAIPAARLNANPAAARCAGCQATHEVTQRHGG